MFSLIYMKIALTALSIFTLIYAFQNVTQKIAFRNSGVLPFFLI